MKIEQISIFLENKTGRLAEVTSALTKADINIRALSLADTSDFGILRMIVNNPEKAKEALRSNGFTVGRNMVVAVEVNDHPGGLHQILSMFSTRDVNVEYMYAYIRPKNKNATMIFRFDKIDEAISILQENNITVLSGETIYSE
ncbi:MAG: ACT domain-containing protein [Desulfovibrionaceae bacterium]|nr:ACT domain-containing protein [Desulfovibrionaceae bacterium]